MDLVLTLDAQRQRLASAFTSAIDGRAGIESGAGIGNCSEDKADVAQYHSGTYIVRKQYSLSNKNNNIHIAILSSSQK